MIVDWTMPDCTGYQVTDCEDTVETAALASNNPPPSFSSTTTATPDTAMMPGAVLSQSPAAGASGRPSSISFLSNPDPLNGFSGGGGAGGDDGSTITNDGDDECDFDDFATPPTWKDLYAENPKELF